MTNKDKLSTRQQLKQKAQDKMQNRVKKIIAISLIALVLVLGTAFLITLTRPPRVSGDYQSQDVVYEQPIFATHDMTGFDPDLIPFLPEDGPQPKIALSEDFYDFGTIGLNDVVSREFVIANRGEVPLTIAYAVTTCGCTTADISASIIPPGKVAVVDFVFDAGYHYSGGQTVRRGLIIVSNDPRHTRTEIWTQASVSVSD